MTAVSMNGYGEASELLIMSCLNHIKSGFRLKMGDVSKTKGNNLNRNMVILLENSYC